jgi:hypothetical protein
MKLSLKDGRIFLLSQQRASSADLLLTRHRCSPFLILPESVNQRKTIPRKKRPHFSSHRE